MSEDSTHIRDEDRDEGDPRVGSGRGGTLGTPAGGNPPDELHPDRGDEDGKFVVSGGGVADASEDDDPLSDASDA